MPPGHFNAVFIQDANKFFDKNKEPLNFMKGIEEANNQGAFVFWNHPHWEANRTDGIAKLDPIHEEVIKKKLLHGIEVVNFDTFSEEAMQIAIDNELTILLIKKVFDFFSFKSIASKTMPSVLVVNKIGCIL